MTRHASIDFNTAVPVDGAEDPKAFLSTLGIQIDSETEAMLRAKLAVGVNGQQAAAIIHFDS